MEFITVEQFREQPIEVQKVFLGWWKANLSDVDLIGYIGKSKAYEECFPSLVRNINIKCFEIGIEIIPLFTEGQLRKFIEDEANGIVKLIQWHIVDSEISKRGYAIDILRKNEYHVIYHYQDLGEDLLQAYWKVACMIAKEEVNG